MLSVLRVGTMGLVSPSSMIKGTSILASDPCID